MASFAYTAREKVSGKETYSSVEAASESQAVAALLKRDLLVLSIEAKVSKRAQMGGGQVGLGDLVIFTRQLATMIDAGLPIAASLRSLSLQTSSKVMRNTLQDLCGRVESGDSFSEALQRHPRTFTRLYVSMVAAGERCGLLAEILGRLATYLENTARMRTKVKSAMLYPAVVTATMIVIMILLLAKVVPAYGEIFASFNATLPAPTLWLIKTSHFVARSLPMLLLVALGVVYGARLFVKTAVGRFVWDSERLRVPVLGPIAHKVCLARFARSFAALVHGGIPILEVLQIVSQIVDNAVIEKAVLKAAEDIEGGMGISAALAKHPVFPDMIVRMVYAGEETGKIDDLLERIADFLDEEVNTTLSGLAALIEPILMVGLGVMVGAIVICMFLPIFKLPEIASH
jgi:type IV pilus assembly protein PilC